jgi:hypothetical protein
MIRKTILITLLIIAPLCSIAQKAYETVNYGGKIRGQTISLILANGYIGASEISLKTSPKAKPLIYMPEGGAPDGDNKLTFKSTKTANSYFIINDMRDAYDRPPATIYGIFISGNKSVAVKLTIERNKI